MKKFLSIFIVVCIVFALAGCTKNTSEPIDNTTADSFIETTVNITQTEETTEPESVDTQPTEGQVIATTPGNEQSVACKHTYVLADTKASTCSVAGSETYVCSKCKASYTKALALAAHNNKPATCTTAAECTVCGKISGNPLGHNWNKYNYCAVCNVKNTELPKGPITFTATVKSDENKPIAGVTVCVFTTSETAAGTAVTNNKGVATMTIDAHTSYKIVLEDVPEEYTVKESYTYSSALITITLYRKPVYNPLDHSKAMYKEGDTMVDFTVTDVNGKTYNLAQLLKQKKLIILDFWYVNCEPCKKEFPYFDKALEMYGDDVILLALNPLNNEEDIRQLQAEKGTKFPMIKENLGMAAGFGVMAYPTTVFIDSNGKIRDIHTGEFSSESAFLREVRKYL